MYNTVMAKKSTPQTQNYINKALTLAVLVLAIYAGFLTWLVISDQKTRVETTNTLRDTVFTLHEQQQQAINKLNDR